MIQTSALRTLWILALLTAAAPVQSQIAFQDVSTSAGFNYVGESFGAAWADYNGDGLPDLLVSNHLAQSSLYENQGNGTFLDVAASVIVADGAADTHGMAWADFDNDGDKDLFQTAGGGSGVGSSPNQLLVNNTVQLVDQAVAYGVDYPLGRGRTPNWFDWDGDGHLDVLVSNLIRPDGMAPTALFSQRNGFFVNESTLVGLNVTKSSFFSQISGALGMDLPLVFVMAPTYPANTLLYSTTPFLEVSSFLGLSPAVAVGVQDVAIADFDGNFQPDLLIATHVDRSDYELIDSQTVHATLRPAAAEYALSIETDGDLTLEVSPTFYIDANEIFIGAAGSNPVGHAFTLDVNDVANEGQLTHTPGADFGLFVSRDPLLGIWNVALSSPASISLDLELASTLPITTVSPLGFVAFDGRLPDSLQLRVGGVYTDATPGSGLRTNSPCDSVVAGDFDNDMDVDAYMVCRTMIGNTANILYENQGNGVFTQVPLAGGAAGATTGRGDTATLADYDLDGFLDIFVTNGYEFGNFSQGPDQLFHNQGNTNNWLEIDLEGVISNRDAIGARVVVIAGGVFQMRDLSGGVHRYSQNHARLHFGLGTNTVVDFLVIQWPNGQRQFHSNVPVNEVIRVLQASKPGVVGMPTYNPGIDRGAYLWRDTTTSSYKLRVSGDSTSSNFTIRLVSAAPVQILGTPGLDAGDLLTTNGSGFVLSSEVAAEQDGVDFELVAGVPTMISVERDGVRDPRDLHVGPTGKPVTPSGWIEEFDTLPAPPPFIPGDLGLFIGRDNASGQLQARWSSDTQLHRSKLLLIASDTIGAVQGVDLEPGDTLSSQSRLVLVQGEIGAGFDGVDLTPTLGSLIGVTYIQDFLFQHHYVNPGTREFGLPNAYRVQ